VIRSAQIGGDRWKHLFHIKNGPSLWDGQDEKDMYTLDDKAAGKAKAEDVMREHTEHLAT